jgi:alkylation response protein AidB-like acyl-CoA dehydrogenase
MIEWSDEQRALKTAFERWHEPLSAGHLDEDKAGMFSPAKWKLVRESGLLRLPFEKKWGGLGESLTSTMAVLEGLGCGCRDGGLSFSVVTHIVSTGVPIARFGSTELKERYLPRICDGELLGAHAITEPESGSDAMSMGTTAVASGDSFVLDGRKSFVSNGPVADVFTVYARTGPRAGPWGVSAFLVERSTPGLLVGDPVEKMGLKTSPVCELRFEQCRVPAENLIGRLGSGFLVLDFVMKWEILCSFIVSVGEMQHRLERCIEYAKTRRQFGQPIGSFQAVANKIVDMKIAVETSRKWLYDTAEKFARDENVTVDVAVSKLVASEGNVASALAALQIYGGIGYLTEMGLEKDLRNAVAGTIYSGTSEIQRNRIATMLGLG